MRRYAVSLAALLIILTAAACTPRVASVGPLDPIVARIGRDFDVQRLPSTVPVEYANGKTGLRKVAWNTAPLGPGPLHTGCTLSGAVEGTDIRATVCIDAQVGTVEHLGLTPGEAAAPDAGATMRERIAESVFVDASLWSPDGSAVVLVLDDRVCAWQVGARMPTAVPGLDCRLWYHDLGWSFDGAYFSVHAYPSTDCTLIAIAYPDLRIACRRDVVAIGYWAPSSHEFLTSVHGNWMASADLAVLNVEANATRIVVRSGSGAFAGPVRRDGPDAVIYDYSEAETGQVRRGVVKIR